MNAVKLSQFIAGFAVVLFAITTANAQPEPNSVTGVQAVAESVTEVAKNPQFVVVSESGKTVTIDLDSESGSISINHDENGESEQVNINLGGIGKIIIGEIMDDIESEGFTGDEPIRVEIDSDDNVTVVKAEQAGTKGSNKVEIKKHLIKGEPTKSGGSMAFMEAMTAITAIILIFGTPLLIVIAVMYGRHKRRALVHQSVNKLIDSGREIPPEIFDEATGAQKDSRKKGIMMVSIGVAISIVFAAIWDIEAGSIGLIPFMIGLAHIAIWKTGPDNKQEA